MKSLTNLLLTICMMCSMLNGQNLIPNGNFEQFTSCPTNVSQFNRLESWFNPTKATPDYFNVCSPEGSLVDVPDNFVGQQYPRSGMGYGGMIVFDYGVNNYREYFEVPLISTLIMDSCYLFEMYVNLSGHSHITIDTFGVFLSDTMITDFHSLTWLPYSPQILNATGFIKDTLNWVRVSKEYYARGGEAFLIIGNFLNDTNTNVKKLPGCCFALTYFFIDDVSLTPCTYTGLNIVDGTSDFNLYPNPVTEFAKLEFKNPNHACCTMNVFNLHGQAVLTISDVHTDEIELDCQTIPTGVYIFQVKTSKEILAIGKLIKT